MPDEPNEDLEDQPESPDPGEPMMQAVGEADPGPPEMQAIAGSASRQRVETSIVLEDQEDQA